MICPHSYTQNAFVRGLTLVYSALPSLLSRQQNNHLNSWLSLSGKEWLLFSIQPTSHIFSRDYNLLAKYLFQDLCSQQLCSEPHNSEYKCQERLSFESFCDGFGYRPPEKSLLTTNSHLDFLFPWPQCDTQKPEGEILIIIHTTHCMGPQIKSL